MTSPSDLSVPAAEADGGPAQPDTPLQSRWKRVMSAHSMPLWLFGLLCLFSVASRSGWIDHPTGLVFDENYYVPAARLMLGRGIDPNAEHPPLAKLFIAGGIRVFGDSPLGWRSPSVIFGTVAVLAMFWLVRSVGGSRWLALGAASVMVMDNLFLVHGRIATLDIFVLAFMLVGVALYFSNHPVFGGIVLGVGACTKLVGLYALVVVILFELLRFLLPRSGEASDEDDPVPPRHTQLGPVALLTATTLMSYLAVLFILDSAYTAFSNPIDHIRYMYAYGSHQRALLSTPGAQFAPSSSAWQWLLNRVPIEYYRDYRVSGQTTTTNTLFQGRMSPAVIYLAGPAFLLAAAAAWRDRDRVSLLILAWFLGTFTPFIVVSFQQRSNYIFYMLIVLPAVYLGVARMFSRRYVPRVATVAYSCLLMYSFWALYPIRSWS